MRGILKITVWPVICLLAIYFEGCDNYSYTSYNQANDRPLPSCPNPPPKGHIFEHTLYLIIETEPACADVYDTEIGDNGEWHQGQKLGKTPLEIPIKFCQWDGAFWFKTPEIIGGRISGSVWCEAEGWISGNTRYERKEIKNSDFPFYLCVDCNDHYRLYVHTGFETCSDGQGLFDNDKDLALYECIPLVDANEYRLKPIGLRKPVKLVKNGRISAQEISSTINKDDYYKAEELRLNRIAELERRLEQNKEISKLGAATTDKVQSELIRSEVDSLKHLVGLLDPQLMALREVLLAKLHEGNVEAALALAQAVAAMEKRYFPETPPQQIIVQAPSQDSAQPNIQSQVAQGQGKQEIVIQQKPYYGAQNIVEALGAMRGSKLDPEAYQKALGGAQLLDIIGFGSMINK